MALAMAPGAAASLSSMRDLYSSGGMQHPRPVSEVVASLTAQQEKLQGLESKLRRLQSSPSPASVRGIPAAAGPMSVTAPPGMPAGGTGASIDQGGLAAFLESVASRIDALDRQLRHISSPSAPSAEAAGSLMSTATARDPDPGGAAVDMRHVRGNLVAGLTGSRPVRRAASADGLRGRTWARSRPVEPWLMPFADQQRPMSWLHSGSTTPNGLQRGMLRGELSGASLMAPSGVEPYSQLAAAAAAVAEDALGAPSRGRSAERLHVHLWASPPPTAPPPPLRPAPAHGQEMPGQQRVEAQQVHRSGNSDLSHQQLMAPAASGFIGNGAPFSAASPEQSASAWQEAAAAAAAAAAGEVAASGNANNSAATAAAAAAAAAAAVAASGSNGHRAPFQSEPAAYQTSAGAAGGAAHSPRLMQPPATEWATQPAAAWGHGHGSGRPHAAVAAASAGQAVNANYGMPDMLGPGSFDHGYAATSWGTEMAVGGGSRMPSGQPPFQTPPSPQLRRITAATGPAGGLPVCSQAEAEAFAELGRKAPQPRDIIVPCYPSGMSPPDSALYPPFPVENVVSATGMGHSNGVLLGGSDGMALHEFPASNGMSLVKEGSSRPGVSNGSHAHEAGLGTASAGNAGANGARSWARVPRDSPHADWKPPGGSSAAPPGPMMGAFSRASRPASAGPSGRAGRYGNSVYQGMPGPTGLRDRDRERERDRERGDMAPSSWSSRPPTWYDGGSEASLSARGAAGGGGVADVDGLGFGGPWRLPDRALVPSEDYLLAK
mmetsp:Transcript_61519/g.109453  ORF Transcript_61519/g.109453 Transcript_61519/m.109453 type:complete len:776 (-) Transcript_61519:75-2402(-)